jgi:hypothetical protein
MSFIIERITRMRKCKLCRETIVPGAACLIYLEYHRGGAQLCEECVRKIYLIISEKTDFDFKSRIPDSDFLAKL